MTSINDFRTNFFNAALKTTSKTFLSVSVMYIAVYILIAVVMGLAFFVGIGLTAADFASFADPSNFSNPEALAGEYQNLIFRIFSGGGLIFIFLAYLVLFLILSWFYNFCYIFINRYIKTNELAIGHAFTESFSGKVFKLFLLMVVSFIMFLVVYFILALIMGLFAMITPRLIILGGIIAFVGIMFFMVKMALATPILILSDKGIFDSIKESFMAFDTKTTFKYILYLIVGSIAITILLALSLGIIAGIGFAIHEALGMVLYLISVILAGGFMFTFMFSLLIGLYYTYISNENDEAVELEENLII